MRAVSHHVGRETLMVLVGPGFRIELDQRSRRGANLSRRRLSTCAWRDDVLPFSAVWSPDNDNPALRRFLKRGTDDGDRRC